jgi:hypothetical protein
LPACLWHVLNDKSSVIPGLTRNLERNFRYRNNPRLANNLAQLDTIFIIMANFAIKNYFLDSRFRGNDKASTSPFNIQPALVNLFQCSRSVSSRDLGTDAAVLLILNYPQSQISRLRLETETLREQGESRIFSLITVLFAEFIPHLPACLWHGCGVQSDNTQVDSILINLFLCALVARRVNYYFTISLFSHFTI